TVTIRVGAIAFICVLRVTGCAGTVKSEGAGAESLTPRDATMPLPDGTVAPDPTDARGNDLTPDLETDSSLPSSGAGPKGDNEPDSQQPGSTSPHAEAPATPNPFAPPSTAIVNECSDATLRGADTSG